jgi:hypothetical protein
MLRRFSIEPISLSGIDTLGSDAIILPIFQEMMQPQGVAGYFDWRLCGRLGRLISKAQFSGIRGETMLLSYVARVGPKKLFLFGLGPPKLRPADQCCAEFKHMLKVAHDSGSESVAISVPQPHAVETLCNWLQTPGFTQLELKEVLILDADGVLENGRDKIRPLTKKLGLDNLSTNASKVRSKRAVAPSTMGTKQFLNQKQKPTS